MPILVYRVDDRLVHGQVVLGWGKPLDLGYIVLVDNAVFASEWERELYRMGMPADIELRFADLAEALRLLPQWQAERQRGMVLTADVNTMADLSRGSILPASVNLGGIHHRPGRTPRLPYVYLTDDEFRILEALESKGIRVTAQDLPTSAPVSLESLR